MVERNKIMTLEDFVKGFTASGNKTEYCKSVVKDHYVNMVDKMAYCTNLLTSTQYKEGVYVRNTGLMKVLYTIMILDIYTDIDLQPSLEPGEEKAGDFIMGAYDILEQAGCLSIFFGTPDTVGTLPMAEIQRFSMLLDDMIGDMDANQSNVVSFLVTKQAATEQTVNAILDLLEKKGGENGILEDTTNSNR